MGLWSRLRRTFRGDRHSDEIREELEFHLHMDGLGGHDRREARLRLGNVRRLEEETRAAGIVEWLDSVLQDARYGLRQLRKTPVLTSAIVLSLAIGLGANSAIFSLIDAAILEPLPVEDPNALVIVEWTNNGFPPGATNINGEYAQIGEGRARGSSVPAHVYRRLAREQTGFDALVGVAAYTDGVAVAVDSAPPGQNNVQYVSGNFFDGIGSKPIVGRGFHQAEDQVGAEPVVVVSHRFWMNRLAGSRDALDRFVRVNAVQARVVGVAAPEFFGVRPGKWPDLYAPIASKVAFQPNLSSKTPHLEDDGNWWIRQIGRPRSGVSASAALAQLSGVFRSLVTPAGASIKADQIPELVTAPGRRGFAQLNARDARALWTLMLLVGVLLLIVCANVTNLLLARSVSRQRESAVRLALGAARTRLFRQHLIESGMLALLGGAAGVGLGYVLAQSIHALFQTGQDLSNAYDLHVDLRILGFTGALSMLAILLFGLVPSARAARTADFNDSLKVQTRSAAGGRMRLPQLLVSLQIALCLAALVAAGLLGRSLGMLKDSDIGFDRNNLVYASVSPGRAGYTAERLDAYAARMLEEIGKVPGVVRVSTVHTRLLASSGNAAGVNIQGRPYRDGEWAHLNQVGDTFFETLGIRLLAGRTLTLRDYSPEREGVVVNEMFARKFFGDDNPLGRLFGWGPKQNDKYEIVGVVANNRYNSLRDEIAPAIYQPYRAGGTINFAIRSSMDAARLTESIRRAVTNVDPAVPLTELHTQTGLIDRLLRTERLLSFLSTAFGAIALTLSAIGLGGLLAYAVARRTNEIGIRMALGAAAADVIRMVLRDSFWIVTVGIAIGIPCAYGVARIVRTLLFRLEPLDPLTLAASFSILLVVAVLAAWVPARRAARIDPIAALRRD